MVSLGCPKNLVDSEKMLGLLAEDGIAIVPEDDGPDAIIINTCGFLEASKQESVDEISRAVERKKSGEVQRVVVAGCLVQRHRAKILDWVPGVDAIIGVFDRDRITAAVRGNTSSGDDVLVELPVYSSIATNDAIAKRRREIETPGYHEPDNARMRLTPRHYAYLRISEGCNQNCAFCTIPSIRGKMRSKPVDRLIAEAHELMADGAFELNLIGQDTTSFGEDIDYAAGLSGMLRELDAVTRQHGSGWLRLMYAYPSCFTDEMIDTIASLDSVVKYIDMPLQHINDRVLDLMRRKTSRNLIETLLEKLRERIPGIAIRTTLISGFPGETRAEHEELVGFVRDFGFEALGVFPYSPEPGTPAGSLYAKGEAIEDAEVGARVEELMLTQQQVAIEANEQLAEDAAELPVLIDEALPAPPDGLDSDDPLADMHWHVGRGPHQAPGVDGITYVVANERFVPGELIHAEVTGASGYDLIAEPPNTENIRLRILG
ncbi:Ribosomal protein S12 methylthiotransferase RimO [Mucisphaera calidilacus]|uniref:Ribosomal protein uS12 methylthiotransferase RimO n=2 Tax=Mucisphaera calidilacus TaxID=2527982 RepID=A0A518BWQ2_9BACT|nr:Ribosomal protein S12 methylthiotransferase RimO [Mucisphaera calidilacus]